ncbi:regulator of microtubule dynamics protein 3 [Latimeria chalumnae]|uniref:Regulator of microtubule dynamics protein 3 n=1 Tax=Latimeria chalumnae TaxID=7897 RepID=H3BAA7_LATCH|nr:PREDICTED: regulator of microtubule dynamics protein 3 isoform X2 [Latimeria chalumnae]XP_014340934.1 PREDICTED: regulator of microtubule dynamics protein 3 isoform X2 [Latimeria chalumnae]|eukprot:XP_014340933.1 PREDICTED: regulator of microtubule dynamics protein 3 isoform X2 [Latimeria chalumnae]
MPAGGLNYRLAFGLAVGSVAGVGLLYVIYRKSPQWRKNREGPMNFMHSVLGRRLVITPAVQENRVSAAASLPREVDADAAPDSVMTEQQVWERLDVILHCITELRQEVVDLRNSLQDVAAQIIRDVRASMKERQKASWHRRSRRERSDSTGSSSIYFTASASRDWADDTESKLSFTTANGESDYERETDRDIEDEDGNCQTGKSVLEDSLRHTDGDEPALSPLDPVEEELSFLLKQADQLHAGNDESRGDGFQLLLNKKSVFGEKPEFLWRLARAYSDMYEITEDAEKKKNLAVAGREEAEAALERSDQSAECHQWYAVLSSQLSEHESMQRRFQNENLFKEHMDRAISLKPDDPLSYLMLGKWCYKVSHLDWLERKKASTVCGASLSTTVQEALENFLKVEKLCPGYSKSNQLYIAKCYKDLEDESAALHWLNLASTMPAVSDEDRESQEEAEAMLTALNKEQNNTSSHS